jgi:hypothetical protein
MKSGCTALQFGVMLFVISIAATIVSFSDAAWNMRHARGSLGRTKKFSGGGSLAAAWRASPALIASARRRSRNDILNVRNCGID